MSLKLAEKKSGIENALVLLPALPAGKTIEEMAAELFSKLRIGARRDGRGILYLYSAKENTLKVEVSYALEGDITDLYCRQMEERPRRRTCCLRFRRIFISELIITTNLRGMGSQHDVAPVTRPNWLNAEFLSGGAGALVHGYSKEARGLRPRDRTSSRGASGWSSGPPRTPPLRYSGIYCPSPWEWATRGCRS